MGKQLRIAEFEWELGISLLTMKQKLVLAVVLLVIGIGVGWYLWPRPPGEGPPGLELLLYRNVQKELKLSGEQIGKIKSLIEASWKAYQELGLDKENVPKGEKIVRDTMSTLKKLITPEQFQRLVQLQMQQLGPSVFHDPGSRVLRKLDLTDQEKDKIKEILLTSSKKRLELYNQGAFKKLSKLDREIFSEIMNGLNGDQKKMVKDMLGEPSKGKLPPVVPLP